MSIDVKSFVLGAVVGYCVVVYKASVSVAKDKLKKDSIKGEEA